MNDSIASTKEQLEKNRLEFYESARRSLEHYKATELHTTHKEMVAWANTVLEQIMNYLLQNVTLNHWFLSRLAF